MWRNPVLRARWKHNIITLVLAKHRIALREISCDLRLFQHLVLVISHGKALCKYMAEVVQICISGLAELSHQRSLSKKTSKLTVLGSMLGFLRTSTWKVHSNYYTYELGFQWMKKIIHFCNLPEYNVFWERFLELSALKDLEK